MNPWIDQRGMGQSTELLRREQALLPMVIMPQSTELIKCKFPGSISVSVTVVNLVASLHGQLSEYAAA